MSNKAIPLMGDISYYALPSLYSLKLKFKKRRTQKEIFNSVIDFICEYYEIPMKTILGTSRRSNVVFARQLCMIILVKKFDMTLSQVGRFFKKDHTTVMHGIRTISDALDTMHRNDEINFFLTQEY